MLAYYHFLATKRKK